MLTCELQLLILILHQVQSSPAQKDHEITPLISKINWNKFSQLVIKHRLWYRYHQWTLVYGSCLPEIAQPTHAYLNQFYQTDLPTLIKITGETALLARQFTEKNLEHCFVKGIVLNYLLYGGLNTRPCRDIDLWVSMKDYSTAIDCLQSLGYQQEFPSYALTGFKKKYHFNHRHDISFYHPTKKLLVELHFKLDYLGIYFFPFSKQMLSTISIMNVPVCTLQHNYHVLYLIIHGAKHAWMRLRWLEDILLYLQSDHCDLFRVIELSQSIGCEPLVLQTLLLIQDLFGWHDKKYSSLFASANPQSHKLKKIAKTFICSDYEITDKLSNLRMFVSYRLYLIKIATKGKKIQALREDLFKIDAVFPYVTFPKPFTFLYYVLYPFWILQFFSPRKK